MPLFDLTGKTAVILGGTGVLGSAMAHALMAAGADLAFGARKRADAEENVGCLGGYAHAARPYVIDASSRESLQAACDAILADFGKIDILVNAVGGNLPEATTNDAKSFFDLSPEALAKVVDLNLMAGAVLPAQVFGRAIVANPDGGVLVHVSSMNAFRPLTRIPAYSAAKAGVSNFTQWLAVHMAQEYSPDIRVNALAPGFILTEQNRFLLTDQATGAPTPRGRAILAHTPQGRFGTAEDLLGTVLWLVSPASAFVTGIVVPVDGGFSAYSGV